jgi:hypothetical protein
VCDAQAKLKTMNPEAKEKYLMKKARVEQKRQSKVKMIRM